MFHRHKWIVLDKQIFPSPFDELLKESTKIDMEVRSPVWFNKKVVVHYKCETCGSEKVTG